MSGSTSTRLTVGARLGEGDARRHRAGERGKKQLHAILLSLFLYSFAYNGSVKSFIRNGTKIAQPAPPQPDPPRRRGRPRAFEPDAALARAMDVFWKEGFAATSLDDLSAATGLNRPSLYGAFGDKRALYSRPIAAIASTCARPSRRCSREAPLGDKLGRIFLAALDLYLSGEEAPRGCFTVLTASSDAVADPEIRAIVGEAIGNSDRAFERLFEARAERANFPPAPIRRAWRGSPRRPSTPCRFAPAPACRGRRSSRSSTTRF